GGFLRRLRMVRGQRVDVAGLPVYVVLTKCDLLARPDDTSSAWLDRIEEVKRQLGERMAPLVRELRGGRFGSIRLSLWATAIGRPAFTDRPAAPDEPYAVAELFRQCFASAEAFDRREHRAAKLLEMAVGGLGLLVVVLALLAALFAASQP